METLSDALARIVDLVIWEGRSEITDGIADVEWLCVRPDLFGVGSFASVTRGRHEWTLRTASLQETLGADIRSWSGA